VCGVENGKLADEAPRVRKEKVRNDRDQRGLAEVTDNRGAEVVRTGGGGCAAPVLIQIETVEHVRFADTGSRGRELVEAAVERNQAEQILKQHGRESDRRNSAGDGGSDRRSMNPTARRQRRVGDGDDRGVAVLFELANDHRTEVRQRRLHPIDR
jgi:hypothetical protein